MIREGDLPITTGEKVAFENSARRNPSSARREEKEGGFGEAMRKWKERTEIGVEKEEKVRKLVRNFEKKTSRNSKDEKKGNGTSKVNQIREMFRKMEGKEKKNPKMTEGWREEDGGGAKRKRMGEDQSETGSGKNEKIRKIEKGVQAERISEGLRGLRVQLGKETKASGAKKRPIE